MASCAAPKRRANPARGKRSTAPMVRTPMRFRRASVSGGQRRAASGKGASCPVSCAKSVTASALPARAATRAASGVGANASTGRSGSCRHSWMSSARKPSTPANRCRLPLTSSSTPSGGARLTRGVNLSAAQASCESARGSMPGRCRAAHSSGVPWPAPRCSRGGRSDGAGARCAGVGRVCCSGSGCVAPLAARKMRARMMSSGR